MGGATEGGLGLVSTGREGRVWMGLLGPEEDEPKTLPWPWNLPEEDEEKGLLTFFMKPLTLSFISPIAIKEAEINKTKRGNDVRRKAVG